MWPGVLLVTTLTCLAAEIGLRSAEGLVQARLVTSSMADRSGKPADCTPYGKLTRLINVSRLYWSMDSCVVVVYKDKPGYLQR